MKSHLDNIIQIVFAWRDEHRHSFHIYRREYDGSTGADTCHGPLSQFHHLYLSPYAEHIPTGSTS